MTWRAIFATLSMKAFDSVRKSIRATYYGLEMFTFLRFSFQVVYRLDLELLHVARDALRPCF